VFFVPHLFLILIFLLFFLKNFWSRVMPSTSLPAHDLLFILFYFIVFIEKQKQNKNTNKQNKAKQSKKCTTNVYQLDLCSNQCIRPTTFYSLLICLLFSPRSFDTWNAAFAAHFTPISHPIQLFRFKSGIMLHSHYAGMPSVLNHFPTVHILA